MNHPTHFRKITTILLLVLLFLVPALFADGIASRYPNDVGIENDPDVILFDGFERYTQASDVLISNGGEWTHGSTGEYTSISTQEHFSGAKSYEIDFPITTVETGFGLMRDILPIEPVLYVRAYFRYDPNFYISVPQSSHKGITMSGRFPGPGQPAPRDGTGWFLFLLQNNVEGSFQQGEVEPGFGHIYAYWPYQRSNYGDHWYPNGHVIPGLIGDWLAYPNLYPDFHPMPNFNVPGGQWFCYELMVKVNQLGSHDGEVKVWLNGNVVADFPDLFIRSVPDLQIDTVKLIFGAHHTERVNKMWWDNVVIARSYIGPISTPTPTPSAATAMVADFNSDGHPDWVVRYVATNQTAILYLNDNVAIGAAFGPVLPAGWRLRGVADFNSDSQTDYALFAPLTLQTALWYLSGPMFIGGAFGPTLPGGWALVATADFNGDGKPDYVVYRASSGQTAIAYMDNNVVIGAAFGPTLPAGWNVVGVADFNGDGQSDYLLFNPTTGQTAIWYLSGPMFIGSAFGPTLPSGWALVATADFDGDGKPDYVVYRASSGQTAIVYMNNNVVIGAAFGPTLPAGWSLVAQ
jgi:FG-GAP-like repeat